MTWFYFSLISAVGYALVSLLSRVIAVESDHPRELSVVFNLISGTIALLIFFVSSGYVNFNLPKDPQAYIYLFVILLFYGLYERFRFKTSKYLEVSTQGTLNNIFIVVAFVIALFIYSEVITADKIFGFIFVLVGILLVTVNKSKKINSMGLFYGVLANVSVGIAWSLDKKGISYFNPDLYNLLVWVAPIIVVSFFPAIKLSIVKKIIKKDFKQISLISFLNVAAYLFNLKALVVGGEATKVIPIVQTSTIITIILGIIFLKEREHIVKKTVAGLIAIIGVFLLV
ncbi:EamA family transporter [Patescibacteria group bacterium]|nr:EamA family transporter [Patescibacteria group bacterium]